MNKVSINPFIKLNLYICNHNTKIGDSVLKNKFEVKFLRNLLILNLIVIIPVMLRKPPIKDWVIVYSLNAVTNSIIDSCLVAKGMLEYPVRFLPKAFKNHILFDSLVYPTFSVIKDKPVVMLLKLICFTIPFSIFEYWADRKTNLIRWKKNWGFHHTFFSITIKSFVTRLVIGIIRRISNKEKTTLVPIWFYLSKTYKSSDTYIIGKTPIGIPSFSLVAGVVILSFCSTLFILLSVMFIGYINLLLIHLCLLSKRDLFYIN